MSRNHGELAHCECSRSAVTISIHLVKQHLKAPLVPGSGLDAGRGPSQEVAWVCTRSSSGSASFDSMVKVCLP